MEKRNWPWKRKADLEKSCDSESWGSISSERHSVDQDLSRASPVSSSPRHAQSPEVSPRSDHEEDNVTTKCLSERSPGCEEDETIKNLNEKLAAALSSISDKEELVRQHATVAEEAVLGWEKAEKEVSSLRHQLMKNSSLESRVSHLDGALKECVRQLRQAKEEQEEKLREAIIKKSNEWDSEKRQFEIRIIELQAKLEAKTERTTLDEHKLSSQLEALKKENSSLELQLASLTENLQVRTLEMEFIIKSAETASKQNLENTKKVAKLEAECRRLHAAARKSIFPNEHKIISNSLYVESLTDSHSDSGERLVSLDNEPSCSDSWASALIAELDQFKNKKGVDRNLAKTGESDLMDDFLEMEMLAALPNADNGHEAYLYCDVIGDILSRNETETMSKQIAELEARIEKMARENIELEMSWNRTQNELKVNNNQLVQTEAELVGLQRQLKAVTEEKCVLQLELERAETVKSDMELLLEHARQETNKLLEKIGSLEEKILEERLSATELLNKCHDMDVIIEMAKETKLELQSANRELTKLQEKTTLLEKELDREKTFSAELAFRCQNMDALEVKKKDADSQLELANLQLIKLHGKVALLEKEVEEKVLHANFAVESAEMEKEKLEQQLELANVEVHMLKQNSKQLEAELEDARAVSAKFAADTMEMEVNGKEMAVHLELARKEVASLQEKLHLLEKEAEKEKALSAEFAAKCQSLQHELSNKKREVELLKSASSDAAAKIRKDNEVALAAGRLAECQKTIASLKLQVKSLTTLDAFLPEKPESNRDSWKSLLDSGSSPDRQFAHPLQQLL